MNHNAQSPKRAEVEDGTFEIFLDVSVRLEVVTDFWGIFIAIFKTLPRRREIGNIQTKTGI